MAKEKMKTILKLFFVLILLSSKFYAQELLLSVVPQPKEIQYLDGVFSLENNQMSIKRYVENNESVSLAINETELLFLELYGEPLFSPKGRSEFIIGIPSNNKIFKKLCEPLNLIPGQEIGAEGYILLIETNRIILSANSNKGLFYGLQTLKQLIKGSFIGSSLKCVRVKDYPSFQFRGVLDDISRGPIPTIDFMKSQIRRLAELKINVLTHYVEHIVKTKKHPSIAPEDGSFTIEEWKIISDYAKKYFITVVGGFQSFGHFQNILKNPGYTHLGESGSLISPVKKESYQFLKDIYNEMIPAFDSPFFNIQCDETFDLGKAESKKLVDSIGYDGVYFHHITKLNEIVRSHGRRTIMWGDIILDYPDLLNKLPKDIVIGTWTYDAHESFERYIKPFKDSGYDFFVSPGVLNSNKIFPNFKTSFGNIKRFVLEGKTGGAFGVLNCIWDDGGTALFTNDWFGVSFGAEKSWNHNSNDADFDLRFCKAVYGMPDDSFTKAIWKLNELAGLESSDGMNDKILFANLVPVAGGDMRLSLIDWKEVLITIDEAEQILNKTQAAFYKNDKRYVQFILDLYRTLAKERFSLIEISDIYSGAVSSTPSDLPRIRDLIVSAINETEKLIWQTELIKSEFEKLWLWENHFYGLNNISGRYQNKIDDYRDIKNRLLNSIRKLDSGEQISSNKETRLAISKLPGKYFSEWMMINPIPNKDNTKLSVIDFLSAMGGELNAEPKVAEEFYYDSLKYRWRRVASDYPDVVNLAQTFPENNQNVVVYAFANISIEKDSVVEALISCDDGIEVILNGISVFSKIPDSTQTSNEFSSKLNLQKGKNNLMLKITQANGDWKFSFRLPQAQVRNSKNRYRVVAGNR